MRPCAVFVVSVLVITDALRADSWEKPKRSSFWSSNGNYVFRVTPDTDWPKRMGWCLGELSKSEGEKETLEWRRYLVNNRAPVQAIVSDSGSCVVTFDEWGHVGTLPLVVYGARGELTRVHNLESLFGRMAIPGRATVSSIWWNEDALTFFGPKDAVMFARLCTGQTLMISMRDGQVMNDEWFSLKNAVGGCNGMSRESLAAYGRERAGQIALKYLHSEDATQRRTGAVVVGQLRLRDAIPRLRVLLNDQAESLRVIGLLPVRRRYVADAAKNALVAMGESP